jgi:hypothetical protein
MKKMAIVPFKMLEEMNRWKTEQQQRPRLPPNPNITQTSELQKDMGSVLHREDLSESEKAQLYGQTLQKFQLAHQKAVQPSPRVQQQEQPVQTETISETMHDRIIDSVPVTMRRKAKLLLQMLKGHPNMSWNAQGNLEVQGKPIPGSNMIDLVNDVLRQRKGSTPRGWQEFSRGLKESNVPQEYVGNRQRWLWMQRPGSENEDDGEDEFFETSSYAPPTPPKSIKREPRASTSHTWETF